jgi:hypothetical protein
VPAGPTRIFQLLPIAVVFCLVGLPTPQAQTGTFAVATWNVHSGNGAGLGVATFDQSTQNCVDASKPRNAWGVGLPQRFLASDLAVDQSMVALAVQEAWGTCGNVRNIAAELGWRTVSPERGGVGLIARYGIVGTWETWQIEFRNVGGAPEDRWIVGANVCVAPDCVRTIYMWTTHLAATADEEWPRHVGKVLDWLERKSVPHVLMGDFNIWQNDQWSPATNCGRATPPMAVALANIASAGYVDAWASTQSGEGWTATVGRVGCGPGRDGGAYKRVDYIWSRGLTAVATSRIGAAAAGSPAPSDHVGIKARFALAEPAPDGIREPDARLPQ